MSDKFERMQYLLIWTATIYIQTRCEIGQQIGVNRRKSSVFVPPGKTASVGFSEEQFWLPHEAEAQSRATAGLRLDAALAKIIAVPLVGWKLAAQSPIYVEQIRLKNSIDNDEKTYCLGVGACDGNVRIPPYYSIQFDLARCPTVADGAA